MTTTDVPSYRLQEFCNLRHRLFAAKMQMIGTPHMLNTKRVLGAKAWNRENGLLRLNFGRQTGNSFWAGHKCQELYRDGYKILVGTPTCDFERRFQELYFFDACHRYTPSNGRYDRITFFRYTSSKAKTVSVFDQKYDFIFLDVSDFIPNHKLEMLMDRFIVIHLIVMS